jgi:tetratricopeptide (TPR) repeat protein
VSTASLTLPARTRGGLNRWTFPLLLLLLVAGAIARSAIATRLDDFTMDEAYHIVAGASYVMRADFRLNPEHPPLVKLWVGTLMSATGFYLSPFRQFHDKGDERGFAEEDVFLHNDPDSVQHRSRLAMWMLNGLLLVMLGLALRQAFNTSIALGSVLFLAIDPTVAAHLPVVMTDLPVALLSAIAIVLATRVFREWRWTDVLLCSLALGLAIGAKHSGIVFWVFLAFAGCLWVALVQSKQFRYSRINRLARLSVLLTGALVILWSLYFFRFHETGSKDEGFNRPLESKVADINSRFFRFALGTMNATHVLPRPYIWGLADTIRGGVEGRPDSMLAFGRLYYKKAPRYFFPGVIALKLPLGLILLVLLGMSVLVTHQVPRECKQAAAVVLAAYVGYLLVLSLGSTYGGIRHALPALVFLSMFGGIPLGASRSSSSKPLKIAVVLAFIAAAVSALPVLRPWEYYNEMIGRQRAYLYFNDEGVDLGQRGKELTTYCRQVLQPAGILPYLDYQVSNGEAKAREIDYVGFDSKRDEALLTSPVWSGTIIIDATELGKRLWWDDAPFRQATPVARFGNVMVFRGTFLVPGAQAETLFILALRKLYVEKPDLEAAQNLLKQSAVADPNAFFVNIELGNVCLRRGLREDALRAYREAFEHAPKDEALRDSIQQQANRVSIEALDRVPLLHNPILE